MYKCTECNKTFYEPRSIKEIHYECDEQPYEIFLECPYCGGYFEEIHSETEEE